MEKITLSELADALAKRKSLSKKDAEAFVRVVFDTIRENLFEDELVKVKGLGTFKLIQVDSRESVHVNTGERIVIDSHSKITFTPDKSLADCVNRPFAAFETVILNDETRTEDMERIDDVEPDLESVVESEPEAEQVVVEPVVEPEPAPVVEPEPEPVVELEPEPVVEPEPESEPIEHEPEPEPAVESESEPVAKFVEPVEAAEPERLESGGRKYGPLWIAILILILGALYWTYANGYLNLKKTDVSKTAVTEQVEEAPVVVTDSIDSNDTVSVPASDPAPKAEPVQKADPETLAADYPQIENGEYWITGVKAVHVLEKGEDLSILAKKYYDDKRLISYIIRMNHYTNSQASNLFVGAEVKIPELVKKN